MEKLYGKVKIVGLLAVVVAVVGVGAMVVLQNAKALGVPPNPLTNDVAQLAKFPYQYSTKFVCGLQEPADAGQVRETPVKPGNYATAVNVHNPARFPTAGQQGVALMLKKAVIAEPEPKQGRPSEFHKQELLSDGATEIDCPEIRNVLGEQGGVPEQFIKGFFVIYSSRELDVVGVYTAQSLDAHSVPTGMTMDVEYIPVRRF